MAAHATTNASTRSGAFYSVRAEGYKRGSWSNELLVGYSPDGRDISRGHCQNPLPGHGW
jgi:hypothetical protein